jgi:short-subunit dehydrogenase
MKARDARILLTGASGGIGKAAAAAFVQAGASVLLVGRAPAQLTAQARDLTHRCGAVASRVAWHAADLTHASAITSLAESASSWGANVVVHGAGLPSFGRFESLDVHDMQQVLNTNLLAPMILTQAMLPHLRTRPRAQVIYVGSALGRIGLPGFSVYSASKFGLRGFAEGLRRELGETSVRIQYLGPRSTRTGFNDHGVETYNRATGAAMDAPELVASAILKVLEEETAERFLGFPEKLAVRLNGLFPLFLDRAFKRHRRHVSSGSHRDEAVQGLPTPGTGRPRANPLTETPPLTTTP